MANYANGHPIEDHQALAEWMGYENVEDMDRDHQRIHELLCEGLGITSYSHAVQDGEELSEDQYTLALLEEAAVIHAQRLLQFYWKCH